MSISKPARNSLLAIAQILLACSCSRVPESYPPPVQVIWPSGAEPAVTIPAGRLTIAMSDPDADAHILRDVYPALTGAEWRFTGPHPAFRVEIHDRHDLDFYIRFFVRDDFLLARGSMEFSGNINGHFFRSYRFSSPGDIEYRRPIPDDWIAATGPIDISIDVTPPGRFPDGTVYGLFLNSIGFARRLQ
jgi:hypothetical protein